LFKSEFKVGSRTIGGGNPTFIVAEIGVNHFGDLLEGNHLVDMAVEAGVDAVKFQLFDVDELFSKGFEYWKNRLREKQINISQLVDMHNYAIGQGLLSFCTPHDFKSLEDIENRINPGFYKIGSGECRNFDFIKEICSLGKPVILSTGMYSHKDILDTLDVISDIGLSELAVLHCVTKYPVPNKEANLSALSVIKNYFNGIVGYSDHTQGNLACFTSVALGAKIIEKHITRRINVENAQDWRVSASQHDLKSLVQGIRQIEESLGTGIKPSDSESDSIEWAQKSIAYRSDLKKGSRLKRQDIITVRPGNGIRPERAEELVGLVLLKDVLARNLVDREDLI